MLLLDIKKEEYMKKFTYYFGEGKEEFVFNLPKIDNDFMTRFIDKNYNQNACDDTVMDFFVDFIWLNDLQDLFVHYFEKELYDWFKPYAQIKWQESL